jgi:lysophospholipase L1-like esterase
MEAPQTAAKDNGLGQLRTAIQRANSGGRPVSVLQYGDSHIAAGIEPKAIENSLRGLAPVDYQTKAKVGITADYPLHDPQNWLDQPIRQANPDLVILSFGSNDSAGAVNKQAYEQKYQHLVDEIRKRAPNASILVVGPTDGHTLDHSGRTLPGIDSVIDAQKEVAAKNGLNFFDIRSAMGGPGSIDKWYANHLAGPDKLHFTTQGYQLLGKDIGDHIKEEL